jgi:hypothetical protein
MSTNEIIRILSRDRVPTRGGLISLWLYKENKNYGIQNIFTLHIPPELHTYLCLRCFNIFNSSKKNSFGCAANSK